MPDISYIKGGEKVLAIVLADSFNVRFRPISLDLPRALLPLCNIPLIDYTLEFLQSAGIKDIYVYCCSHSQQISEHIQKYETQNQKKNKRLLLFQKNLIVFSVSVCLIKFMENIWRNSDD